jgi:hypothetical protein
MVNDHKGSQHGSLIAIGMKRITEKIIETK